MNYIGVTPTRTRPISYNPLRAGQFRGYGGCNVIPSRTTIVNNNIIGYGGPVYSNNNCCHDSGMSTGMKWMLGLGIGGTLLGGILSFFGIGGGSKAPDGQGAVETEDNSSIQKQLDQANETIEDLKEQIAEMKSKPETTDDSDTSTSTTDTGNNSNKIDYSKFTEGELMNCIDQGGPRPINGKLSNIQKDSNGCPTSFTITDTSENKSGNVYEYVLSSTADDGTPTYRCIKKNSQNVNGTQEYNFENGELIQKQGMQGFAQGIKTAADKPATQASTPAQAFTASGTGVPPEGTMEDRVSDTFTMLTPYFHKDDGKYHAVPDKEHSFMDLSFNSTAAPAKKDAPQTAKSDDLSSYKKTHFGSRQPWI